MPKIRRYILLNYSGENTEHYNYANSDAQALKLAREELERQLGKVRGALRSHFNNRNNWEVKLI
jgi:hypothetical protein